MKRGLSISSVAADVRRLALARHAARCVSLLTSAATALIVTLSSACAHEVRPAFLELTERAPGEFDVLWKVPAAGGVPLAGEEIPHEHPVAADANAPRTMPCGCPAPTAAQLSRGVLPIHPSMPRDAQTISFPRSERLFGAEVKRWTIRVPRGLEGWEVSVHGLSATMVDVLVRVAFKDGRVVSRLLRPDAPSFVFEKETAGPTAGGYFVLGVEHILLGVDHLLFVLCLLLLVRGLGPILKTITAFTLAHSITLAFATLGVVKVPSAPVEAVIALSIVFVAAEVLRRRNASDAFSRKRVACRQVLECGSPLPLFRRLSSESGRGLPQSTTQAQFEDSSQEGCSITARWPWVVAFTFGLLHGFGFAGALSQVGLPANDIPLALLFFNVGVEAGQLLFVAAVLGLVAAFRPIATAPPAWLRPAPAYGIGAVASYWLIARVVAFW